jgi:hypothetical protein
VLVGPGYAVIYKYTDKAGVVCFADDLQAVPQTYRSKAVIVEGELKEDATQPPKQAVIEQEGDASLPKEQSEVKKTQRRLPLSFRLMISALVSFGAFIMFMMITRQTDLKENKRVESIIRTSLAAIVTLYLVIAHAKDVMTIFGMAGKAVDEVQQQSAEKGKKAAQAIKTFDALFEEAQKAEQTLKKAGENNN